MKWLQREFSDLLPGEAGSTQSSGMDQLTSGQMLLMGFNGLFTRLESDFSELLDSLETLDVPAVWKKVDTVREAKSMQVPLFMLLLVNYKLFWRFLDIDDFGYVLTGVWNKSECPGIHWDAAIGLFPSSHQTE